MNMGSQGSREESCLSSSRRRNRKKLSLYLWRPLDVWVLTLGQEKGGRIFEVVFKVLNSAGDPQNRFSLKVFKWPNWLVGLPLICGSRGIRPPLGTSALNSPEA